MTLNQILNNYTYDQLKEMYRADRKLVQDRLYKMGKTEFKHSKTYKEYYNKLPKLRNLKTKEELAAAFYDTDRLIRSGFTTISKQREQQQREQQQREQQPIAGNYQSVSLPSSKS